MAPKDGTLRVGIDATQMLAAERTGLGNYAASLVEAMAQLSDEDRGGMQLFVYLHTGNPFAGDDRIAEALGRLGRARVRLRVYSPRRGYGLVLSLMSARDRLDLLHYPSIYRARFRSCPYVLTVPDFRAVGLSEEGIRIAHAEITPARLTAVRESSGIICISESAKSDLHKVVGSSLEQPVQVIHLAMDDLYLTASQDQGRSIRHKHGLGEYILFVGTLQYRKNLPRLVEAFALLKRNHQVPHQLVLAGPERFGAALVHAAVEQCGVAEDVVFLGYVPHDDLPGLYAAADVFAFPSIHEGFGIPLLEAMACGTVVVTSSVFSMPEVAGDAAIYVDPFDVEEMASGLWRALGDDSLRQRASVKGRARAREFGWSRTAEDTLQFYRYICRMGHVNDTSR